MQLGEKIRTLRKERGMTQGALAGDRITRSMLCEIEKGKASPSLDTLLYLAEALDVPPAFLIDDSEDIAGYRKREALPKVFSLYSAKKYAECFHLCENLAISPDDELAFLLSHCALEEGKRAFRTGNMETALVYFQEAAAHAQKTVYPTANLEATAILYTALAENIAAPRRDFNVERYRDLCNAAVEEELFSYMTDKEDYPYKNECYTLHLRAHRLLSERRYREALPLLLALEERKSEPGISAYFLFRLYSDMEVCYREEGNFEKAYKYASKRMTLLSAFQS